jgi:hypothetical protein
MTTPTKKDTEETFDPLAEPLPLPEGFEIAEPTPPVPVPYKRRRKKKRRRPKKPGRPRIYVDLSPSKRTGVRHHTIMVPEITFIHLRELKKFYNLSSMGKTVAMAVEPLFNKAYEEAVILEKIEKRKRLLP